MWSRRFSMSSIMLWIINNEWQKYTKIVKPTAGLDAKQVQLKKQHLDALFVDTTCTKTSVTVCCSTKAPSVDMNVANASKDCMSLGHIVNQHDVAFLVQHFCDLQRGRVTHPNREGQATGIDAPVGGDCIADHPKFSTTGCKITEIKVSFQSQRMKSSPIGPMKQKCDTKHSLWNHALIQVHSDWGESHWLRSHISCWNHLGVFATKSRPSHPWPHMAVHLRRSAILHLGSLERSLGDLLRPSKMNLELETLLFEDLLRESPKRAGMGK